MNTHVKRNARNSSHKEGGLSVIELLAGIVIVGVMIATAIVQMQPALQQMRANNAMYLVSTQFRSARQSALAHRRNFRVQFVGNNEIQLWREEQPGPALTLVSDIFLNPTVTFQLTPGLPDTPDGYGNAAPIVFGGQVGGPPIMKFQSDGALIDGNGNAINGTVFLGIPNMTTAGRAVTVLGATGRVRSYRFTGTTWSK